MFCTKCGSSNDAAVKICIGCGEVLSLTKKASLNFSTLDDDAVANEVSYKAVLGKNNQDYYLDCFDRFDKEQKIVPYWNWAAFFVTFFWLLYRKMWRYAAIYFFVSLVLLILFRVVGMVAGGAIGIVLGLGNLAYLAAVLVMVPLYANGVYYLHCKKLIESAHSNKQDGQGRLDVLSEKGGTSKSVLVTIASICALGLLGVIAAVALPAYQAHTARAQVTQAMLVGNEATAYVDNYFRLYRSIPSNLDAANFMMSLPKNVKAVSINNQLGVISITMQGSELIEGKSLKFVTSNGGGDFLSWHCMSDQLEDDYLPQECRRIR